MQKHTNLKELRCVNSKIRYSKIFQVYPSAFCVCVQQAFENCISLGASNFYLFVGGALAFQSKRPADTQKHFIDDMMIKQFSNLKRKNKRMHFKQYPNK